MKHVAKARPAYPVPGAASEVQPYVLPKSGKLIIK